MSKLKDTLRFSQPVCYFKTRIKYDYCTVRNAHFSLIGNLLFGSEIHQNFRGENPRDIHTSVAEKKALSEELSEYRGASL
jgi:hypothetical protein